LLVAAGVVLAVVAGVLASRGTPVAASTTSPAVAAVSQATADPEAYAALLRQAVDDARAAAGRPRLAPAPCATPVAQARAAALVGQPLAHAPLDELRRACAPATTDAENLSRAAAGPADVVAAWMASAGHRANILDPTLTAMTVACVHDGEQMLCSQLFTGP
jgi:uncharacterized protein YkwD